MNRTRQVEVPTVLSADDARKVLASFLEKQRGMTAEMAAEAVAPPASCTGPVKEDPDPAVSAWWFKLAPKDGSDEILIVTDTGGVFRDPKGPRLNPEN